MAACSAFVLAKDRAEKHERLELAEEIARFVEGLPATIQTDVCYSYSYGLDEAPKEIEDFVPTVKSALTKSRGMKRMSATIRVAAALDFIL